jgi:lipoprotein-anchoring transpeptidase ErfK/SrfK
MAKFIVVTLDTRTLEAFDGATRAHSFSCLIGREGHRTTPGRYRIGRKHRNYTSRTYNAPMNFAMFFSADGKAIHESESFHLRNLGMTFGFDSAGSHGCVGLPHDAAETMFNWTPPGTRLLVRRDASEPVPADWATGGQRAGGRRR